MTGLPPGWAIATLQEVSEVILDQSPPGWSYNTKGEGIPFFQGKATFGSYYPAIVKWTTAPKKLAKKGDILLSVRAPVGPTNIAPVDCAIGRGLHAICPVPGIDRDYLLWAIRVSIDQLVDAATGSTFSAITGQQVRSHKIPITPSLEQKRIAKQVKEILAGLDTVESALKAAIQRIGTLRRSDLTDAFAGRLVPQDPEDEPASVLLSCIINPEPNSRRTELTR